MSHLVLRYSLAPRSESEAQTGTAISHVAYLAEMDSIIFHAGILSIGSNSTLYASCTTRLEDFKALECERARSRPIRKKIERRLGGDEDDYLLVDGTVAMCFICCQAGTTVGDGFWRSQFYLRACCFRVPKPLNLLNLPTAIIMQYFAKLLLRNFYLGTITPL